MELAQKWTAGLIGLGALFLVVTQAKGLATALGAGEKFLQGTESTAITGKVSA